MKGRRGLATVVVACAVAAGVVLFAVTRTWQDVLTHQVSPLPPMTVHRDGTEIAPWLPALAVVALAGAGALLATRGIGRLVVAAVLGLSGAGIVIAALAALGDEVTVGWPLLCALAGLVVVAAGVATARSARTWPAMGARYDRAEVAADPWTAMDRGEDPTEDDRA